MMNKTKPADMMPMGPSIGRCNYSAKLPGLTDLNPFRCGREDCHVGDHAFHPEFDDTLGPIIAAARAAQEVA